MKDLIEYIRQPEDTRHISKEFAKQILTAFAGRKAKTEVEKLVRSAISNDKVGVMVAFYEDGKVLIGYAQWNELMDDYDKYQMLRIAWDRAFQWKDRTELKNQIPFKVEKALPGFLRRVKSYYKDKELVEWAKNY